jgi:hypothetical protein
MRQQARLGAMIGCCPRDEQRAGAPLAQLARRPATTRESYSFPSSSLGTRRVPATCMPRWEYPNGSLGSWQSAQNVPASARGRRTVIFDTPAIRVVELMEFPSANAERIVARFWVLSFLMPPLCLMPQALPSVLYNVPFKMTIYLYRIFAAYSI